jgi:hypothetical protein
VPSAGTDKYPRNSRILQKAPLSISGTLHRFLIEDFQDQRMVLI